MPARRSSAAIHFFARVMCATHGDALGEGGSKEGKREGGGLLVGGGAKLMTRSIMELFFPKVQGWKIFTTTLNRGQPTFL